MVTKEVSYYASKSPCEFIAETYSMLCDNKKVPEEILDLYQKLGRVMI